MMNNLPLSGIRVAECTWVIAGPLMTKYLAFMGAEVIRIESEKRGEFRERGGGFSLLNNNKKSCHLDLSQPRARELARAIIARSDVVVENFGTGVMDRLGLGYEALREIKSDLVMLSCSGLGRTGPDRDKIAYGTLLQLYSGWSLLQGHPNTDGILVGGAWTDPLTAVTGAFALLAALHHRAQTGEGQHIDLSMVEATLCGIPEALMDYSMNQRLPTRQGNRDTIQAPHGCYPCAGEDQWVAISVQNEAEWTGLRQVLGNPAELGGDAFADAFRRKKNEDALDRSIADQTRSRNRAELVQALQQAGVAAGPSQRAGELLEDAHLAERGAFVPMVSPKGVEHRTLAAPWRITPAGTAECQPAPRLGQDDNYVFKTLLGLSDDEVQELIEAKIVL